MMHRTLSTAWFVVFASLTAPSYAAAPEFKAALVTESRTYYREELRKGVGACTSSNRGMACGTVPTPFRVAVQRVTVALEGERITFEWTEDPMMTRWPAMLAKDFPLDADVQVAIRGNELLLIHPKGNVVTARGRVVKSDEDERE